jgi:hypothetical protein
LWLTLPSGFLNNEKPANAGGVFDNDLRVPGRIRLSDPLPFTRNLR